MGNSDLERSHRIGVYRPIVGSLPKEPKEKVSKKTRLFHVLTLWLFVQIMMRLGDWIMTHTLTVADVVYFLAQANDVIFAVTILVVAMYWIMQAFDWSHKKVDEAEAKEDYPWH